MTRTQEVRVDPTNADALRAWTGTTDLLGRRGGDLRPISCARYREPFCAGAAITPYDRVLDVGCGSGQTTLDAARLASTGSALGVDLSSRMLERARQRAAEQGVANAAFLRADTAG